MTKFAAALLLIVGSVCADARTQLQQQKATPSRPTVLVTAGTETDSATNAAGAGTAIGHVAVGGASVDTSTYEHSEVWEVVRHFQEECPAANFVTNPETPHTLTIHTDYQKISSWMTGTIVIYQLALLDHANNPIYVSKKKLLRGQIKPICKLIQRQ